MNDIPSSLGRLVGESHEIALTEFQPDPEQPRLMLEGTAESNDFSELGEEFDKLADSIKETGLGEPIKYRWEGEKRVIVDGHRRWTAFRKLSSEGLEQFNTIPAVEFQEAYEGAYKRYQLVSNTLREGLNAMEEAKAYEKIKVLIAGGRDEEATNVALASIIGKSPSTVSEILKLNTLPEHIQDTAAKNNLWSRHILLHLAKQENRKEQDKLFSFYAEQIKEGKKPKRVYHKKPIVKAAQAQGKIESVIKSIGNITISNEWNADEKVAIKSRLEEMKKKVDQLLSNLDN